MTSGADNSDLTMLLRRSCRKCKKLLVLLMIGVTVCLGFVLHASPDSVRLDQLQRAYEELSLAGADWKNHDGNEG